MPRTHSPGPRPDSFGTTRSRTGSRSAITANGCFAEAGWATNRRKREVRAGRIFWNDHQPARASPMLSSRPGIETLRAHSKLDTVGWDLNVPDVMRAAAFINELKEFETKGEFPEFSHHLSCPMTTPAAPAAGLPTPAAQIADNDLAMGQIVEALSHSKFWPETCIFAIEDDPQAGWDHVSGYRTTFYVVSPYTKRRQTISTQYNHTGSCAPSNSSLASPR